MRLIYFAPVNWHSYHQRSHQMVKYFLKQNKENKVLWINPYPTRLPQWKDIHRLKLQVNTSNQTILENLKIISVRALPFESIIGISALNEWFFWNNIWREILEFNHGEKVIFGIGKPSQLAIKTLNKFNPAQSFYDAMDDFPEFYQGISRTRLCKVEQDLISRVNTVFASSTELLKKFSDNKKNIKLIKLLNGYDMALLPKLKQIRMEKIVIGYIGTIGNWFDWDLVIKIAKKFTEASIRLIGPCYVPPPCSLPDNIVMYPECSQTDAIKHIQTFTVGIIPFKKCKLTVGIDPIKYYEYRGMGLPTLTTRFGEMIFRNEKDGVYFLDEEAELKKVIIMAIDQPIDPAAILKFREQNDWRNRFDSINLFR